MNGEAVKWGLAAAGAMIPPAMFVAGAFGVWLSPINLLALPLLFIELIVAIIFVTITLARQRADRLRASGGQLPPPPGQHDRAAEAERHGSTGHESSPPETRTEQTRADLPIRKSRPGRRILAGKMSRCRAVPGWWRARRGRLQPRPERATSPDYEPTGPPAVGRCCTCRSWCR